MVHTSLLVNIIYGAWYTLTRVDLECCREAALLLLVFVLFFRTCWTLCEVQTQKDKNYLCYQLHLMLQVHLLLLSRTHLVLQ